MNRHRFHLAFWGKGLFASLVLLLFLIAEEQLREHVQPEPVHMPQIPITSQAVPIPPRVVSQPSVQPFVQPTYREIDPLAWEPRPPDRLSF